MQVKGWVYQIRSLKNIKFIILRTFTGLIQITVKDNNLFDIVDNLGPEYLIEVEGDLIESKIAKMGKELIAKKINILKTSETLPLDIWGKTETAFPTRMRYRYLDLRRPKNAAIMRIRSKFLYSVREYLNKNGFFETQFPIIIASATEGGAELFPIIYFGEEAYLAQSGQLYKQSLVPVLGKVYSIAPSFRAEKSRTRKHLTEFWQIDVEVAFASKKDLMDLQFNLIKNAYEYVKKEGEEDLRILGVDIEVPKKYETLSYEEAIEILKSKGFNIKWGDDFGADEEKALCKEFENPFFITEFPKDICGFYYKVEGKYAHRIDFMGPGEYGMEWSSGGPREEDYEILKKRMIEHGINPEKMGWYLEMFKYGFPPHGGFGIGVERVITSLLKLESVKEAIPYPRTPDYLVP